MKRSLLSAVLLLAPLTSALLERDAQAWGNIGHRIVAETAAQVFEADPETGPFGPFASRQRFELGLYATLPDTAFRSRDRAHGKVEGPSHFLDLDFWLPAHLQGKNRELALNQLNKEWQSHLLNNERGLKAHEAGTRNATPTIHGSLPWRISALKQRAKESVKELGVFPSGYQGHSPDLPPSEAPKAPSAPIDELKRVYDWLWWAGVLAHYTGDSAVPYHASEDYNGFKIGQGGIHFYFEADCIQALSPGIERPVLRRAQEIYAHWKKSPRLKEEPSLDPAIAMTLSVLDRGLKAKEIANQLDRKSAILKIQEPGSHTFAKRKPAMKGCTAFRSILVEQLAVGAAFTAHIWKESLPENLAQLKTAEGQGLFFAEPRWNYEYPAPPPLPTSTPPSAAPSPEP